MFVWGWHVANSYKELPAVNLQQSIGERSAVTFSSIKKKSLINDIKLH